MLKIILNTFSLKNLNLDPNKETYYVTDSHYESKSSLTISSGLDIFL